jgi:hypothetical protein
MKGLNILSAANAGSNAHVRKEIQGLFSFQGKG